MDIYAWPSPKLNGAKVDKQAQLIAALQHERAGYLRRGQHARVAFIDEVLAQYGVRELASVEPHTEAATATKGKKRKSR